MLCCYYNFAREATYDPELTEDRRHYPCLLQNFSSMENSWLRERESEREKEREREREREREKERERERER